jgi:hypothetical protein
MVRNVFSALAVSVLLFVLVPGKVEAGPAPDSVRQQAPDTSHIGRMDSAFAAQLAAPLSGWLAHMAEGHPGFALSGFRRVLQDTAVARPWPRATGELSADSVQLSLRQRFGYIHYSPDRSRYVDLNLYSEIVAAEGDTQFLSGPDQTVLLVDPGRGTTAPLQNYGSGGRAEEAAWLDDSTLALAGWEEIQPPPHQVRAPFVKVLRLDSGQRTTYLWSAGDSK